MISSVDQTYIAETLQLAERQRGRVSPHPLVACVLVKDEQVLARGVHAWRQDPHAEVVALKAADAAARGATLYVNLEPCGHWGENPPCVDQIIAAGISRVVYAVRDPNPKVLAAQGLERLKAAGILVEGGVLEQEALKFNEAFFKHVQSGLPFVTLKWAMSLDGKLATRAHKSQWISGAAAQLYAHRLRRMADVVLVGLGTVLADDPLLTVRHPQALEALSRPAHPVRLILDARAELPLNARVLNHPDAPTWVAVTAAARSENVAALAQKARVLTLASDVHGHIDWNELLAQLGREGLNSVLIEGGQKVQGSAMEAGVVDKIVAIVAPKIIGGKDALAPVGGTGALSMAEAQLLYQVSSRSLGEDILIEAYTVYSNPRMSLKRRP